MESINETQSVKGVSNENCTFALVVCMNMFKGLNSFEIVMKIFDNGGMNNTPTQHLASSQI